MVERSLCRYQKWRRIYADRLLAVLGVTKADALRQPIIPIPLALFRCLRLARPTLHDAPPLRPILLLARVLPCLRLVFVVCYKGRVIVVLIAVALSFSGRLPNRIAPIFVIVEVTLSTVPKVRGIFFIPNFLHPCTLDLDLRRRTPSYWIVRVLDVSARLYSEDIVQNAIVVDFLDEATVVDGLARVESI
jgi:hypothetical protein